VRDPDNARGPYSNEVGEALYRSRMTISELARRVGESRQDLSEIVNGHRLPSAAQFDAMCEALAATAEQLYPTQEFRAAIEATRVTPAEAAS
jgi:transcriptional regulator with XRE-family HTH domain